MHFTHIRSPELRLNLPDQALRIGQPSEQYSPKQDWIFSRPFSINSKWTSANSSRMIGIFSASTRNLRRTSNGKMHKAASKFLSNLGELSYLVRGYFPQAARIFRMTLSICRSLSLVGK